MNLCIQRDKECRIVSFTCTLQKINERVCAYLQNQLLQESPIFAILFISSLHVIKKQCIQILITLSCYILISPSIPRLRGISILLLPYMLDGLSNSNTSLSLQLNYTTASSHLGQYKLTLILFPLVLYSVKMIVCICSWPLGNVY